MNWVTFSVIAPWALPQTGVGGLDATSVSFAWASANVGWMVLEATIVFLLVFLWVVQRFLQSAERMRVGRSNRDRKLAFLGWLYVTGIVLLLAAGIVWFIARTVRVASEMTWGFHQSGSAWWVNLVVTVAVVIGIIAVIRKGVLDWRRTR